MVQKNNSAWSPLFFSQVNMLKVLIEESVALANVSVSVSHVTGETLDDEVCEEVSSTSEAEKDTEDKIDEKQVAPIIKPLKGRGREKAVLPLPDRRCPTRLCKSQHEKDVVSKTSEAETEDEDINASAKKKKKFPARRKVAKAVKKGMGSKNISKQHALTCRPDKEVAPKLPPKGGRKKLDVVCTDLTTSKFFLSSCNFHLILFYKRYLCRGTNGERTCRAHGNPSANSPSPPYRQR